MDHLIDANFVYLLAGIALLLAVVLPTALRTVALSAPVVAERVGISRATAQRYLSALANEGHLAVELQYGATGRPEHRYRAAIAPPPPA